MGTHLVGGEALGSRTVILRHRPATIVGSLFLTLSEFAQVVGSTLAGKCSHCGSASSLRAVRMAVVDPLPAGLWWKEADAGLQCVACKWWVFVGEDRRSRP